MGMRLGLEPMREVCARLGHPERELSVVHVAGTNGKGSVSAMVESIARRAGMRTGLYTSPHLCRFAERIRVNAEPIADEALADALTTALDEGPDLSFFETATLAAMLALRDARVDVAVLEVGIGGRLDATNVIPLPRAAAITRIAFDHMDLLGHTLRAIAQEKAGISKPGLDLVLGPVSDDVRSAIDETARLHESTTSKASDDLAAAEYVRHAPIGLAGEHQRDNACVAYVLGKRIGASREACERGIRDARWPGRLETIETDRGRVLIDAAHNPDGAQSLAAYVSKIDGDKALVFGTLADKAWPEMIDALAPRFPHRVYVAPKGRAATEPAKIAARHPGQLASGVMNAYEMARAAVGKDGLVVAAGSIFLIGELRARLLGLPRDPPIAL